MRTAPGLDSFRFKALLRTMKAVGSRLIASRSANSIRVMRAAAEIGIRTVSICRNEYRFAAHCFAAE